ncbi:hypothetical protein HAX54_043127 [Datura stramonium]|uniref:Uncharacterized protein n=1 Tax=Datura stramonium TaxID=4076 RepID=A0ABS8W4X9_DATST|nr:hypothetical protein [Datura stramonium]
MLIRASMGSQTTDHFMLKDSEFFLALLHWHRRTANSQIVLVLAPGIKFFSTSPFAGAHLWSTGLQLSSKQLVGREAITVAAWEDPEVVLENIEGGGVILSTNPLGRFEAGASLSVWVTNTDGRHDIVSTRPLCFKGFPYAIPFGDGHDVTGYY